MTEPVKTTQLSEWEAAYEAWAQTDDAREHDITEPAQDAIDGMINAAAFAAFRAGYLAASPSVPPEVGGWKPDREAVARLIDPEAMRSPAEWLAAWNPGAALRTAENRTNARRIRRKAALAKADAILALSPPPPGQEEGK
jgi:hypothetical protein